MTLVEKDFTLFILFSLCFASVSTLEVFVIQPIFRQKQIEITTILNKMFSKEPEWLVTTDHVLLSLDRL